MYLMDGNDSVAVQLDSTTYLGGTALLHTDAGHQIKRVYTARATNHGPCALLQLRSESLKSFFTSVISRWHLRFLLV